MMRSVASSKSNIEIDSLLFRAAMIAASLQMFLMSAPLNPGVNVANLLAQSFGSMFLSKTSGLRCTSKISHLPSRSGKSTSMSLSKRPGRMSAGSSTSFWFVAANTITLVWLSKPSISTNNWFKVVSLSSLPPPPIPPATITQVLLRFLPTASISSTKMIEGALALASWNKLLTLCAPTPTYISINSLPLIVKKGTLLSPAQALANMVLPVPGGPVSKAPLGILAPSLWYFSGVLRKSMNYTIYSFAFCMPTTSWKVTFIAYLSRQLFSCSSILLIPLPPLGLAPRPI